MSVLNGRNGRNGRAGGAIGTATDIGQGDFEHAGGSGSPLLSEALIVARDGVLGQGPRDDEGWQAELPERALDMAARMLRLSDTERSVVLLSELAEGTRLAFEPDGAATLALPGTDGDDVRLARVLPPGTDFLRASLDIVESYADLREDRLGEIVLQVTDQLSFTGAVSPLQPAGYPRTLELLSAMMDHVSMVVQRMKLAFGVVRPEILSPRMQPMVQTPSHGAFPSGHAAQAFCLAETLVRLRHPEDAARLASGEPVSPEARGLYRMASRVAANRTVAGVHYPVDSAAGALLGRALAAAALARAGAQGEVRAVDFEAERFADPDGAPHDFHAATFATLAAADGQAVSALAPAPLLSKMREEAVREWRERS